MSYDDLPEGTAVFETEDGLRWAEIDGEVHVETDDGAYHPISAFDIEPDEDDDEVPEWAKPLLDRAAREAEDDPAEAELEAEEDESPAVQLLRANPHLLDDLPNFEQAVELADGDLDLGLEYYTNAKRDHEATLADARIHEGIDQPASVEAGIDEWQSEQREAKRAEPYRHDPVRGDDPMQDAVNSLVDDLHETNQTNAYAQEIVRQERRGR